MQNNKLIPRDVFFGNPDKMAVKLSPDGSSVTFVAPKDGILNVWIQKREDSAPTPLTFDKGRGIRSYTWAYDNTHILYTQDRDGDENWRLFSVNTKTGVAKTLVDQKNVQVRLVHTSEKHPDKILVSINDRTPNYHDLYLCDLKTGSLKKIYENNEFIGFMVDDDFNLKLALKMEKNGAHVWVKRQKDMWHPFLEFSHEDGSNSGPLLLTKDEKSVYVKDSRGSNFGKVTIVNLETGKSSDVILPEKTEISTVFDFKNKKPAWYVENYLKPEIKLIDEKYKQDFDLLKKTSDGFPQVISSDVNDKKWIVAFLSDAKPVHYYIYDRATHKITYLFSNKKSLESITLQPMHAIEIEARDGLKLPCYLTLPEGYDLNSKASLPAVINVHGGPEARDAWGLDVEHQWLANRGYAVLSVNFRGSSGFGKRFVSAGNGEWAGKMHDDLIDAKNWLITRKIAHKDMVAIMGGSYGGYATLVGLTMTPQEFACGVSIVGMSNLLTLYESIPPYWKPIAEQLKIKIGGDPSTKNGKKIFEIKSPINYVKNIQRPLLIAHGANDPRVKQNEADQIVAAMKERNIPVTYALYPNEGHGFARPENRLSFYALTEEFLSEVLGGQFLPLTADEQKSALQLKEPIKNT